MTETKWTPGPWRFSIGRVTRVMAGDVSICGVHHIGRDSGADGSVQRANGSLIEAAPDLYEALSRLVNEYDAGIGNDAHHPALFRQAETALAKARGEKPDAE